MPPLVESYLQSLGHAHLRHTHAVVVKYSLPIDAIHSYPLEFVSHMARTVDHVLFATLLLQVLRNMKHEPEKKGPKVVTYCDEPLGETDYDVVICGGTLGLFLATALQLRGHRVCIVEKRLVQGRNQEWNISRGEVNVGNARSVCVWVS